MYGFLYPRSNSLMREKEMKVIDGLKIICWKFIGWWYLCFGGDVLCSCGHSAKRHTFLSIDGTHAGLYTIPCENDYCPQCFKNAAIKCAWCSELILPGSPVTLYTPMDVSKLPSHAVFYKKLPEVQVVGCLRWECADSGADRAGFWEMPGQVLRVASPLEMAFATGEVQVTQNLADPTQAIPIQN